MLERLAIYLLIDIFWNVSGPRTPDWLVSNSLLTRLAPSTVLHCTCGQPAVSALDRLTVANRSQSYLDASALVLIGVRYVTLYLWQLVLRPNIGLFTLSFGHARSINF